MTTSDVRYELSAALTEEELEPLFAEAWGAGSALGYDRVLQRSLAHVTARLGSRLVGFVNLAWDGGAHAFILDTVVRADTRRSGIGLELVRRAIESARQAGIEWVHVDYEPHLDAFYGKAGLRPTGARVLRLKEPVI
jgi:GNAT superfamily N-acetyltransferase